MIKPFGDNQIVICGLEDYDEIMALWNRSGLSVRPDGRDAFAAFARQSASGCQRIVGIRTAEGQLIAVAVFTHDGRKGWINRLAVDPEHRRQGLARQLVAEGERFFTEEVGVEVWAALIEGYNRDSQALFAALGFYTHDVVYVSKRTRTEA